MITDPVANMLSAIKNGYQAGLQTVVVLHSKYKENIARVFADENFLEDLKVENAKSGPKKTMVLKLKYTNKVPAITDLKQVSKPGLRVYVPSDKIQKVLGGLGVSIISTPQGVMSSKKAKKLHTGGELICKVW